MSYFPSNTLLHASIILTNLSFAYTLPIIGQAFPFHIVTIVAYGLTVIFHTFILWTGKLENKSFTIKIVMDDDPQEETPVFSVHSTSISPSSWIGIILSLFLAVLWTGAWISRIVFMIILYSNATFTGLLFLMLQGSVAMYIAVQSVFSKLKDNGSKGTFGDLQMVTKKGIDDIFMRLGQLQTPVTPFPEAIVKPDNTGATSHERKGPSTVVSKERKD
ncbi:hypothetical protein BDQ17DRAFT_1371627, partial [Cyathus striatus]